MPLVDLSHPLVHGQQTFPSDPKLSIVPHGTTATLRYNISQVVMSTHQGTHLDAMYHFVDDGKTLDQMPLDWFEVHHILLAKDAEIVVVESLAHLDQIPDAITFIGFPLNFAGRDGSPIRAVAMV